MKLAFHPTNIESHASPDGENLGVRFENADNCVDLTFRRNSVATIFQLIMAEAKGEQLTAIGPTDFQGVLEILGLDIGRLADGNVGLSLRIRTDDGMKSMAWNITPETARKYATQLNEYAEPTS